MNGSIKRRQAENRHCLFSDCPPPLTALVSCPRLSGICAHCCLRSFVAIAETRTWSNRNTVTSLHLHSESDRLARRPARSRACRVGLDCSANGQLCSSSAHRVSPLPPPTHRQTAIAHHHTLVQQLRCLPSQCPLPASDLRNVSQRCALGPGHVRTRTHTTIQHGGTPDPPAGVWRLTQALAAVVWWVTDPLLTSARPADSGFPGALSRPLATGSSQALAHLRSAVGTLAHSRQRPHVSS